MNYLLLQPIESVARRRINDDVFDRAVVGDALGRRDPIIQLKDFVKDFALIFFFKKALTNKTE